MVVVAYGLILPQAGVGYASRFRLVVKCAWLYSYLVGVAPHPIQRYLHGDKQNGGRLCKWMWV